MILLQLINDINDYDINLIYLDCNIIKIYSTKIIRYMLIDVLKIA